MTNTMSRSSFSQSDGHGGQGGVEMGIPVLENGPIPLVKRVTCPHCWFEFRPEQVLWVSQHEELMGDPVLKEEALRFLPTRFTVEGQALDARGWYAVRWRVRRVIWFCRGC